ncbi:MAG: DNA recombination protein RmuC [Bacteroidales bacterium]|nr:DNA recombination protein RmuC [Bacteroidales bacterium]MBQ8855685.1 DNA recombination protein RmuC [Bacteroidales bacterium]MBQ9721994.1 DNA recombination protein RmuC [Bacteroidales bacterium]
MIYIIVAAVLVTALLTYLVVALASARKDKVDTAVMLEMMKAQMTAESERVLKEREEELERRAKTLFENLSAGLDKDINSMKDAFEKNRMAHVASSQRMKENIDNAVRNLREQTMSIGDKADNLAEALKGRNKAQGNWGEVILDNLFTSEGLREGRDYDKEETLRDEHGNVVYNEDTDRRMRPDFILHYPDGNDVVVDSKVVLTAMYDYYSTDDEQLKADAVARNLAAMKEQVRKLARKDYSRYLRPGHKMLDFVIMFVPVYSALRLAYEADRNLWQDAYDQGVLIATEETMMPFLRMISIAWKSHEQVANQQQIIAAAEMMLSRVSDFCTAHAKMGEKLEEALKYYEACDRKLRERGQSIVGAANKLISYGVPRNPKKSIPQEIGAEETEFRT